MQRCKLAMVPALLGLSLFAAACSEKNSAAPATSTTVETAVGEATTIDVALADDTIELSPEQAAAGPITFAAVNDGTVTHEIELFEGEGDPASLPITNDVADTQGWTLVDEIEDITPGSSAELDVELAPGTYQVVCNLPEHFEKGTYATLEVA